LEKRKSLEKIGNNFVGELASAIAFVELQDVAANPERLRG